MPSKPKAKQQAEQTSTDQPNQAQAEEVKPKLQRVIYKGDGEPKKKVMIGMLNIELPSADDQRRGFETEHAKLIVTTLSHRGYRLHNPLAKD